MNGWGRDYITKYISKYTVKNTVSYRVWINRHDLKVSEGFKTLEEAIKFRDEVLRLCEVKRLEQVKINLDIKEYPFNLIEALNFNVENVISHFEQRLEEVCKNTLTDRETLVLMHLYKEQKILEEVGKELGVTRERIKQIRDKALRKLKFREKYFELGDYNNLELLAKQKLEEYIQENKNKWNYENAKAFIEAYELEHPKSEEYKQSTPIEELDFSVRTYNCLRRSYINTLEDITSKHIDDLMKIRNMGRKSVKEIVDKLHELGLKLKEWD